MSDDDDSMQGWAAHEDNLRQQEEAEAREALAFASAVATVASYLERCAQIPHARIEKILFTLADWPDNPPAEGNHH